MRPLSRVLVVLAVLLIGVAYIRPLWHIALEAPQYPEGLGMYIWADKITGEKPQDLDSINGLNHYIGMKRIVPESIPELRLMPMLLGGLAVLGGLDQVSVVIRGTLMLVRTPDALRGRVNAVHNMFVGASNELGEFESGVAAYLLGPVIAVAGGGVGTLLVVLAIAALWPEVRRLGRLQEVV